MPSFNDSYQEIGTTRIQILLADLTQQQVDAVVNSTNHVLEPGGGVDYAIHNAAGPRLRGACRRYGSCDTAAVRVTRGYQLPARHIFHTVSPIWQGGGAGEIPLLCRCYQRCLEQAARRKLDSIAFPSIGTGACSFPVDLGARIALLETVRFLRLNSHPRIVHFVATRQLVCDAYGRQLAQIVAPKSSPPEIGEPFTSETQSTPGISGPPTQAASMNSQRFRLRQWLNQELLFDSDLDAFCIDHFPMAWSKFSTGMDRVAKLNILLVMADPNEIVVALRLTQGSKPVKHKS